MMMISSCLNQVSNFFAENINPNFLYSEKFEENACFLQRFCDCLFFVVLWWCVVYFSMLCWISWTVNVSFTLRKVIKCSVTILCGIFKPQPSYIAKKNEENACFLQWFCDSMFFVVSWWCVLYYCMLSWICCLVNVRLRIRWVI